MTSIPSRVVDEAEALVRGLAADLTRPRPRECLCCYVLRMLIAHECDGTHRHALRYRDALAPRATALVARLGRVGACCCDCELFMNGYELRADRIAREARARQIAEVRTDPPPAPAPPCAGVRRGSVQPCVNWARVRRGW